MASLKTSPLAPRSSVRSRSKKAAAMGSGGRLGCFRFDVADLAALDFAPVTAGSLDRAEKREKPRWGVGASQPGNPFGGGPIVGNPSERKMGGLLASFLFVKVCTNVVHLATRTRRYEASVFLMVWL